MKNTVAFALGVAVGYKGIPIATHVIYVTMILILLGVDLWTLVL